jgi:hypothetical protein
VLTHNAETDEGGQYGHHDTNPAWCVAFVRYENPVSSYGAKGDITKIVATDPMVIENDCISVECQGDKNSFAKRCSLTMKAGDVFYPNAVRNGDWVMVWIHDGQQEIDEVVRNIKGLPGHSRSTFDFNSGLKFVGRVVGVSNADVVQQGGIRTITQTIVCQAFVELASAIYFTGMATYTLNPALEAGTTDPNKQLANQSTTSASFVRAYQKRYSGLMDKYLQVLADQTQQRSGLPPDRVMALILVFTLGIDNQIGTLKNNQDKLDTIRGNFNDAILVPKPIAKLLGRPEANRLWQFYSIYLGVQQYRAGGDKPWRDFIPVTRGGQDELVNYRTFRYCPTATDGSIWFEPPLWANRSIWSILGDYLNPVVNEMYTCLRINPHPDGNGAIQPTIMVREKPFSTGLFNYVTNQEGLQAKIVDEIKQGKKDVRTQRADPFRDKPRTFYCNVPRWVIDESLVKEVVTHTDENDRVNFVQVWGNALNNATAGFTPGEVNRPEVFRANQTNLPNWYVDQQDVQRHGLRPDISESNFDYVKDSTFGTRVNVWARMRADWLFNGQLRPKGTITLAGIPEPIVEGDNVQVRGIVYHVESVQHMARLEGGRRTFVTILGVSHGILADSLKSRDLLPQYPFSQGSPSELQDGPGVTDVQQTFSHGNRDELGERSRTR